MKTTHFLSVIAISILFTACNFNIGKKGNEKVVTQERPVSENFNEVRGSAGIDVFLTQGEANKIVVEADENLHQYIETTIENGKLYITTSEIISSSKAKNVYVTFKELSVIESSSGADVTGNSVVKSQNLSLRSSSGADLKVEVFAQQLTAKASSGANMVISGKTTNLNADASSGAEIEAKNLITINCSAEASSGAEIIVNVKEKLDANVSSGGDIDYYGNPLSVKSNDTHSGSVNKM